MNWTEADLRAFTQRRLKQEEPARVSIQSKVAASRTSYNSVVVTAFFKEHNLPAPVYEHQFCLERKWRFDLAFLPFAPGNRVAIEVQGGLWTKGAHVRPARMIAEFEKWNTAASMNWRILFVTPDQLMTAATADLVRRCLGL